MTLSFGPLVPVIHRTHTRAEAGGRWFEANGLVVLAMNAGEAYGPASGFVEELPMESLTAIAVDPSRGVIERYRVFSMPTSIFINAEGEVTRVHPGFATAEQMDAFAREALGLDSAVSP